MQTELKSNLKSETFWVRTLFTVAFFVVFRLLDLLVIVITLVQWLFMLFSGKPNAYLQQFSAGLAQFSKQIIDYLGCCSSDKPFPFQDWPVSEGPMPYESSDEFASESEVTSVQASTEPGGSENNQADKDSSVAGGKRKQGADAVTNQSEPSTAEPDTPEPR